MTIRTRKPTKTHRITVRLLRKQIAAIKALAINNGLSFGDQYRMMLSEALGK